MKIMLNSKMWTDEELLHIRLKNMAQWDEEDFIFYKNVNNQLLTILEDLEVKPSIKNDHDINSA